MGPEVRSLMAVVSNYCYLIEHCEQQNDHWLLKVADLLPQIHAAIVQMDAVERREDEGWKGVAIDLDRRFDLYVEIKALLGENDPYWLEFDFDNDFRQMSGSLADDLTDIYCELKQGLDELNADVTPSAARVLTGWRKGYRMHWGQHLLDAERHLYTLDQKGRL
jgi:hypothetical protein